MALTKIEDVSLSRDRKGMKFTACNILIALGTPDTTEFADRAAFDTFLADFSSLGVNGKGSPNWTFEDLTRDIDFGKEVVGVKGIGNIVVMNNNKGFTAFLDTIRNKEVTVVVLPKKYVDGDEFVLFEGIKLTSKTEGKVNDGANSGYGANMNFEVEADKRSDVEKFVTIPAAA